MVGTQLGDSWGMGPHMQLKSEYWQWTISSPVPCVWCESHPKSVCQFHSGDSISHNSISASRSNLVARLPSQTRAQPRVLRGPYWHKSWGSSRQQVNPTSGVEVERVPPQWEKPRIGVHTCSCLKTGAVICPQPLESTMTKWALLEEEIG